jgi:hypothetical protein
MGIPSILVLVGEDILSTIDTFQPCIFPLCFLDILVKRPGRNCFQPQAVKLVS